MSLLRTLIAEKRVTELKEILEDGYPIEQLNDQNSDGQTALFIAIKNRLPVEILKLLVQKGADSTICDKSQWL